MRLAFRLSYFGTHFSGSQMQKNLRTVEGEFIGACQRLELFSDWRKAGFFTAGRTDRGVHSRGMIAAFTTHLPERAIQALNNQLPRDAWCTGWAEVPDVFHPRYDAHSRTYRYYFPNSPEDLAAMRKAAELFLGTHDFSNFARTSDRNPLRTVLGISVETEEDRVYLQVTAESFLWNQVRRMAAVLQEIGSGTRDIGSVQVLLESPAPACPSAASPEGLILWDVDCGIVLNPLPTDPKSEQYCSDLLGYYRTMETVSRVLGRSDIS
ncbi:MAG: tRNA pseudouridine(38-40) synthase TruA [Methanoregulaceae archaeon]